MSNFSGPVFSRSPLSVITNTNVAKQPTWANKNEDHNVTNTELAEKCQEKDQPFGHTDEEEEKEDDEVFFGIVTSREKAKTAKLRRKTRLFVTNFRDMLEVSDESLVGSSSGSEEQSPTAQSTCQRISLSLNAQDSACTQPELKSSTHSPVMKANPTANHMTNHAAVKIQRWFRHSCRERRFREVMSEIDVLDVRTDDILQKIRKEEERIRICNTPTDSPAGCTGARFDVRVSSAVVIMPIHTPSLIETSPQLALQHTPSLSSNQLHCGSLTQDGTTDIVFDATEEETCGKVVSAARRGLASVEDATFTPISLNKSTPRTCSTEITHTNQQFADKTTSAQRVQPQDTHTPSMLHQSYLTKNSSFSAASFKSSLSSVQSGSSLYKTLTVPSVSTPYHVASRTRVASTFGGSPIPSKPYPLSYTPLTPRCTIRNTRLFSSSYDACKLTSSTKSTQSSYLQHLDFNVTGAPSYFAKACHQGIQSPTVFSSPRLFPMTVQAVQSVQPLPSAVLFSPHKPTHQGSVKLGSCSGLQEKTVETPKGSTPRDNGSVFEEVSSGLDINSFGPEPGNSRGESNTLSRITQDLPMSPNVSFRKSAQKIAIITPRSKEKNGDECSETTIGKIFTLQSQNASQQHVSNQFSPSPVVTVREIPDMIQSSPHPSQAQASENSDTNNPLRGPHEGMTSPEVGPRSNDTGRHKLELLHQKKAELARIRAQKAEIQQRLEKENELCFTMRQEIQAALQSNTSQRNIPVHLLSLGCQGVSSLTLTEQELDIVTRLHTIRNSHKEDISRISSPIISAASNKGSLHLQWHLSLVTEVHHLSSPSQPRRVAKPILSKHVSKARRVASLKTDSPARRLRRQVGSPKSSILARTPREKLPF